MPFRRAFLSFALGLAILATSCGGGNGGGNPGGGGASTLAITTPSLAYALELGAYSQTLQASGGTGPYTWSAVSGLPDGIALSSGGILGGTTPAARFNGGPTDEYSLSFRVQDSSSPVQSRTVSLLLEIVRRFSMENTNFSPGNVGVSYQGLFAASGGIGNRTWAIQPGSNPPPPGLTLDSEGNLRGIPTTPGTFSFTVEISDAGPPAQKAARSLSLVIKNTLAITTNSLILPIGVVTKPYQAAVQAAGGTPPYRWTSLAPMPPGLILDSVSGMIAGIPTQANEVGTTPIEVMDSSNPQQLDLRNIRIPIAPALSFLSPTLPDTVVDLPYILSSQVVGGIPPYTFELAAGALPPGITFPFGTWPGNAQFQGKATAPGTSNFTMRVTDSEVPPVTINQPLAIRVNLPLLISNHPDNFSILQGQFFSYSFQATGGLSPLSWFASAIPGLSMDPVSGILSGVPTSAFNQLITIRVTDSSVPKQSSSDGPTMRILLKPTILSTSLPGITANSAATLQLAATGGVGQYTWAQVGNNLPSGLTFNTATGAISGKTTQTGAFSPVFRVTDAGPPAQTSDPVTLNLVVSAALARNNSPATATQISNGAYQASISPIADPPTGVAAADSDYYKIAAAPGATILLEVTAQRLTPSSPLDSVLEIVDSSNNRLPLCNPNPLNTNGPFTQPCVNDDLPQGVSTDSKLVLQVPTGNSGPLTFYAHVLDFRGDARPDFLYTISVTGAN